MEVVRQNADCNGLKGATALDELIGCSQTLNFLNKQRA